MADTGATLQQALCKCFKAVAERIVAEAKMTPDDREDLGEDQDLWVVHFGEAMVSH